MRWRSLPMAAYASLISPVLARKSPPPVAEVIRWSDERLEGRALQRDRVDRDVGAVRRGDDLCRRRLRGGVVAVGEHDQHAPPGTRVGERPHAVDEAVVERGSLLARQRDLAQTRRDRRRVGGERARRRHLVAEREDRELVVLPLLLRERPCSRERTRERLALHGAGGVDQDADARAGVRVGHGQPRDGLPVLLQREPRRAGRGECRGGLRRDARSAGIARCRRS